MQKEKVSVAEQAIIEFEDMIRPLPMRSYKRMVEEQEQTNQRAVELGIVEETEEPLIF